MLNHNKKQKKGITFNSQNSQLKTFSLPGTRPKSVSGKSSSCRFLFSAVRNAITKATEYQTFGCSWPTLFFFRPWEILKFIVCERYKFFSVLAAVIREISTNERWTTSQSGAKGEWRDSSSEYFLIIPANNCSIPNYLVTSETTDHFA